MKLLEKISEVDTFLGATTISALLMLTSCIPANEHFYSLEGNGRPSLAKLPSTNGWVDASSKSLEATIQNYDPKLTYLCKFGHTSEVGALSFSPCVIQNGKIPLAKPSVGKGNGTMKLVVRVLSVAGTRDLSTSTYVHDSLNQIPGLSLSRPDSYYFNKASEFLDLSLRFGPGTSLENPFMRIEFPPITAGLFRFLSGGAADPYPGNTALTVDVMSLRKQFVLNSDGTLVLIKRRFVGRHSSTSTIQVERVLNFKLDGSSFPSVTALADFNLGQTEECEALVLSANRKAICFYPSSSPRSQTDAAWVPMASRLREIPGQLSSDQYRRTKLTSGKFSYKNQAEYDDSIANGADPSDLLYLED